MKTILEEAAEIAWIYQTSLGATRDHSGLTEHDKKRWDQCQRIRDAAKLSPSQPLVQGIKASPAEVHAFERRDLSYDIWVEQHRGRPPRHDGRVISIVCAKCGRYEDHPTHIKTP